MARSKRYRLDSGRARATRERDRAQLEFDDLLIDQFLTDDDDADLHQRRTVPVRFGAGRLADFLDDSTIAAAIIRSGDLDDEPAEYVADDTDYDSLFDVDEGYLFNDNDPAFSPGKADDETMRESTAPRPEPVILRPPRNRPIAIEAPATFSVWGVAQGFLLGTGGDDSAAGRHQPDILTRLFAFRWRLPASSRLAGGMRHAIPAGCTIHPLDAAPTLPIRRRILPLVTPLASKVSCQFSVVSYQWLVVGCRIVACWPLGRERRLSLMGAGHGRLVAN